MITLEPYQVIDIGLRFAAVGQLIVMAVLISQEAWSEKKFASMALVFCIMGYILLTTPVEDQHYGWLRQPLLLLTDLTAFVLLFFAQVQLKPNQSVFEQPKWITIPILGWCLFLVYFFLITKGNGFIHDLNHGIGMLMLLLIIYLCGRDFLDDLDNQRRQARLLLIVSCSIYMAVLTLFEMVFVWVKDTALFSLSNALVMLMLTSWVLSRRYSALKGKDERGKPAVPPTVLNQQTQKLKEIMEQEFYCQSDLTIGKLATEMAMPEHQLRQLINQQLGFSNFSQFLNSYRIPAICQKFSDPALRQVPILTLALDMGYGSIAPFNRAFKAQMGMTPTEYRDQFQK